MSYYALLWMQTKGPKTKTISTNRVLSTGLTTMTLSCQENWASKYIACQLQLMPQSLSCALTRCMSSQSSAGVLQQSNISCHIENLPDRPSTWGFKTTSNQAQRGDFVFWVPSIRKALIVGCQRKGLAWWQHNNWQICATAAVPEGLDSEVVDSHLTNSDRYALTVDLRTIYLLTPPYGGEK